MWESITWLVPLQASFLSSGSDESFPFKSSRTGVNLWTHIKLQDGISWYHVYKLYFWPPCNWATMWLELLEKLLKVAMRIPPAIRSSIVKKAGNSLTWVELLIAGLLVVKCRELLDLRLLVVELELLLAGLLVAKWAHTKIPQIFILKSWPSLDQSNCSMPDRPAAISLVKAVWTFL